MRTNSSPRGADTYVARVSTCRAPCLPFFFSTRPLARAGAGAPPPPPAAARAPCVIRRVKPRPTEGHATLSSRRARGCRRLAPCWLLAAAGRWGERENTASATGPDCKLCSSPASVPDSS